MKLTSMHWAGILVGAAGAGIAISKFEQAKKAAPAAKAPAGAAATAKVIANAPKAAAAAAVASAPPAVVTPQQIATSGGSIDPKLSAMLAATGWNSLDAKGA